MSNKMLGILCLGALIGGGCGRHKTAMSSFIGEQKTYPVDNGMVAHLEARLGAGGGGFAESVLAAPRYVAVRHKLEIVEPGSGLQKSVEAVVTFCGSIQCEVLSSNISGTTPDSTPSGNVALRVLPQDLDKLLAFVAKQGKVAQHSTETEDKTAAAIDVEAKLKNQTEFRDNLRKMLARPGVSVADLLQIQEKLAEAQAELDSEATQRKVLANETEKVAIEIEFRAEHSGSNRSAFAPIWDALGEFGSVLAESLAALITIVAAIIPWLIVIVPGGWVVVRAFRRWRERKRAAAKNQT